MKGKNARIVWFIISGVFLAVLFCHGFCFLDPSLIYFRQQPLFLFDKFFLYRYLNDPGGMAGFLSLFVSQFFYSKLAGSLLLVLIAGLVIFLSYRLLTGFFSRRASFFLQFMPALLFIYLHSHYEYDLRADMTLIFAFFLAFFYHKAINRRPFFRMIFLVLSDGLLFWFFGIMAVFIFSALAVVSEIYRRSDRFFAIPVFFQLTVCISLMLFMVYGSGGDLNHAGLPGDAFTDLNDKTLVYLWMFYGCIPFLLFFPVLAAQVSGIRNFFSLPAEKIRPGLQSAASWILVLMIPFLALFVCRISFDRQAADAIQIHAFAAGRQWTRVLETAQRLSLAERKVIFQVNRALYQLDRLPDEAFGYAQYWGEKGLILTSNYSSDVLMLCSDLYFDMGHVKESLHWAYEAQTKQEQSPEVLKRIAVCNLIMGEYLAAEKFFSILSGSVVHRKWALHYLDCLKDENLIGKDPLVKEKRKWLPRTDFYANTENPQYDLFRLFSENADNKMATEYFMVYSLLKHDLSGVVLSLKCLEQLRYKKIPVHIEEALLLFMTLNETYPVDLGRYSISDLTQKRFAGYSSVIMKYRKDMQAARDELFNGYGNTYWYYIHYVSPITTRRKMHEKTPE